MADHNFVSKLELIKDYFSGDSTSDDPLDHDCIDTGSIEASYSEELLTLLNAEKRGRVGLVVFELVHQGKFSKAQGADIESGSSLLSISIEESELLGMLPWR